MTVQDLVLTSPEPRPSTAMELLTAVLNQPNPKDAVEIVKELTALHREELKRKAEQAFHEAVARFKENTPKVVKNRENSAYKNNGKASRYSDLPNWLDTVTPELSKQGLTVSWEYPTQTKEWINVTCILKHELGHSEKTTLGAPPTTSTSNAQTSPQLVGITVKYMQRYTIAAILGMDAGDEDTDGNMMTNGEVGSEVDELMRCETLDGLKKAFDRAANTALERQDIKAYNILKEAKDKRKKELS
jgi:hypothetical protein